MRRRAIPTGDLAALGRVVRRTALVRAALVLGLVAALAAGAALAREPEIERVELVPAGTSAVVVLDVSASVEGSSRIAEVLPDLYVNPNKRIRAALETLADRDEPVGLVVFSDVAYELLPPGSPGRTLAPLVRFFAPVEEALVSGADDAFLQTPWSRSFSGGTQISAGLSTALEMLERDGSGRGSILLLSDLDAPDDPVLTEVLGRIREAGVTVRIVSLLSDNEREQVYRRILGNDVFIDPDELERALPSPVSSSSGDDRLRAASLTPIVLAGTALLLLLGLHELVLVRLPLPRRKSP